MDLFYSLMWLLSVFPPPCPPIKSRKARCILGTWKVLKTCKEGKYKGLGGRGRWVVGRRWDDNGGTRSHPVWQIFLFTDWPDWPKKPFQHSNQSVNARWSTVETYAIWSLMLIFDSMCQKVRQLRHFKRFQQKILGQICLKKCK